MLRTNRRGLCVASCVMIGVLAAGLSGVYPQAADPIAAAYDVTPRKLSQIPPGTVIGKEPPKGWSHLIIKSHPRVGAGDVNAITPTVTQLAGFMFTSVVANVQAEPAEGQPRHRLTGLGVGMGVTINGQDTIVTPETQQKLGGNLGFLARLVLSGAQDGLGRAIISARSNTLAILDTPAVIIEQKKHRPAFLRYAVLIDAGTGRLETLLWLRDREGAPAAIEWLPANKLEDCILHVDANECVAGHPTSENAFAMLNMPKGQKQLAVPEELKATINHPRLTAAMAYELEYRLRDALLKNAAK